MKRYKKDQKIRLSNLQLLNVTKNVHNLIFNNAHIYLKQNELKTDGKIENIHRQIVLELLDRINKCACINDAINLINEWYKFYNTERTKSYKFWNKQLGKWDTYRMTPIQSLTFDYERYT